MYGKEGWELALHNKDGWNWAQSVMNLIEVTMTMFYLHFVYEESAFANVVAIIISTCTAYKTIAYFLIEAGTNWSHIHAATNEDFWVWYILPSSFWIILPVAAILNLCLRTAWRL